MMAHRAIVVATSLILLALLVERAAAGDRQRPPGDPPPEAQPPVSRWAAPLPATVFKTHFNSGSGKYLFRGRGWDLGQIKKSFNTVIVDYGKPDLVDGARAAGLAVIVEFDEKDRFARGESVAPTVLAIIRQVEQHPGTIAAIRVADRLDEKVSPAGGWQNPIMTS